MVWCGLNLSCPGIGVYGTSKLDVGDDNGELSFHNLSIVMGTEDWVRKHEPREPNNP